MFSTNEPNDDYRRASLQSVRASLDKPFQRSNPVMATLRSMSSHGSPPFSDAVSTSSLRLVLLGWTIRNWLGGLMRRPPTSSRPASCSRQSTKHTRCDTAVPAGRRLWTVAFHRDVAKDVASYGLSNPRFAPTLGELIEAL